LKLYSYFLPQFYPTPENDKFWGKDFTDWVSTRNGKPLFDGHKQPYRPLVHGEYDLSDKPQAKKVIDYSVRIGIDGLIYWHYWFSNGFQTLEKVPEIHLSEKKINQKFCFAWANADWTKSWQGDNNTIIFKQIYSESSAIEHFNYLKSFFSDSRYIKFNGNFLFQVNHGTSNEVKMHMKILDDLCFNEFGSRIHFLLPKDKLSIDLSDFNHSLISFPPGEIYSSLLSYKVQRFFQEIGILNKPVRISQNSYVNNFKKFTNQNPDIIPCILSGWDNTARYKNKGVVLLGNIKELIRRQIDVIKSTRKVHEIILVKAFNEWAEGNIIEPHEFDGDIIYPYESLEELKK